MRERKRIETQLLQTETQYRLLFATNPNPMWIFDLETLRFLAVNQAAILNYGYSEPEFLSMTLADIRPPEQISYLQTAISNFKRSSCPIFVCEAKHCKRDGTIIDVEINSHRITWEDKAAGFALIKDITAEKTALRDRQQSQALLEEAQQVARLGNWEYNLETGKINWSKQLFNLYNRDPAQLEPNYQELLQIFHPEDAEKLTQAVQHTIATGESYKLLLRVIKADNSIMYLEAIGHADFHPNGEIVRLYGTTQDITERIQAEEKLRQSEAQLVNTQKIAHVGSWELDFNTYQRSWSKETFHIFGLDPHQVEPNHAEFLQMVHPEDRAAVQTQLRQIIAYSTPFCLEYRIIRPDGSIRYVESRAEVTQDHQGNLAKLFGAILDITERKQAEAALARSEEQLRLTFEFNQIGTWNWNVKTGEVVWNDNHYRLLGLDPATSAATYQTWRDTVHPEDIERVEQLVSKALIEHTNFDAEYRVIHPDGSMHWLTGRGRGIYNAADEPIRILGIIIDISDRKFAEQALQEKETFLRSIYNSVGQAIFVVDVINNDFRYVGLNHTHEILTGLDSNELQGKTPEQILPPNLAAIIRQHYQDCLDAGDTITYEESLPFQGQQTWWITTLTPLKDVNSRIYRIVGNSVNISDRKRTEQMLELQAVITRNMAEGICLIRADDGVTVYTNPKFDQMFGYESGELIGQHVSVINYEDDEITAKSVNEVITANIMQYGEFTYEVKNIKKDGTCFWSSATSSVFEHPEHGTVFVTVQQDITEQKQAEEKIKASLKEKEVLLKEIHHRVKNNLGIVSSLLQMQYRRTQDSQATAILLDSKNRIASISLVHEKLYRSDDLANINFAQYIPDLTTHLFDSYNVSSSNIQLNIQVEDVSLDIETAIPCGLIINELVSNALKYAFPIDCTGKIQVSLSQASNHTLILIIRDNGVGLPAEFESKKTKTLGMNLIQGLVKQLRGTLEINSQQGTEFKISFTAGKA
ncbi:PAS domain S-box protein [Nostoc sp. UHCC 0870]|uniref:PAS domain S-box protein n=1 Tax=Nostoc sp. UHCC 0870 TaxID=2914041 RepID=UPI001EE01D05|nr:PAS domain S-box protein [Nostoc sp. UHCC 0870]UKO96022.1 PAS domain S-box protein [Nostoc sp. UHCC 0870]